MMEMTGQIDLELQYKLQNLHSHVQVGQLL